MDAEDAAAGTAQQQAQWHQQQQQQQAAAEAALPAAGGASWNPAGPASGVPSLAAAGRHGRHEPEPEEDVFGDFSAAAAPPAVLHQASLHQQVAVATPATPLPNLGGAAAAAAPWAAPAPAAPAPVSPQLGAAIPSGVRRDAPLPLDLFGEELEDAALGIAIGLDHPLATAAAAGAAAVPAAPSLPTQALLQAQQGSAAPPAGAFVAPPAAGSWDADDDFADFQGPEVWEQEEAQAQEQAHDHEQEEVQEQEQEQEQAQAQEQEEVEVQEQEFGPAAAGVRQAHAAAGLDPATQRLPSTFTDRSGRLLAVDYADRFVRTRPQAPAVAMSTEATLGVAASVDNQPAGAATDGWGEDSNGLAVFGATAIVEADSAVSSLPQHVAAPMAPLPAAAGSRLPSTFTDHSGRALAVDYAEHFVRQPPRPAALAEQQQSATAPDAPASTGSAPEAVALGALGEWAEEEGAELADFCSAAPEALVQQQAEQHAESTACSAAAESAAPHEQAEEARQQQGQEQQPPSSPGSGGRRSALLSVLHPISPRASGGAGSAPQPPLGQQDGWQAAALERVPAAGSSAAASADGAEVVTEYAVAWAKLLQVRPAPRKFCLPLRTKQRLATTTGAAVCSSCRPAMRCRHAPPLCPSSAGAAHSPNPLLLLAPAGSGAAAQRVGLSLGRGGQAGVLAGAGCAARRAAAPGGLRAALRCRRDCQVRLPLRGRAWAGSTRQCGPVPRCCCGRRQGPPQARRAMPLAVCL